MGIDDLKAEITQYHLQVEEVLSGMDRVLTEFDHRLKKLEQAREPGQRDYEQTIRALESRMDELQEQVAALGRFVIEQTTKD